MSYCRTGEDSDVYVVWNMHGYNCLSCSLTLNYKWPDACFATPNDMLSHLQLHQGAGQKVPDRCIDRIYSDKWHGRDAWWLKPSERSET